MPEAFMPEANPDQPADRPDSFAPEESALEALKARVAGLTWMSESDYPFEVSQLPSPSSAVVAIAEIRQLTGHDSEAPIEVISVADFFAPAIQAQDWHEAADEQRMQRFVSLLQWIEQQLSDVCVYRIGMIEINIYIVGQDQSKNWVCLATKAIET